MEKLSHPEIWKGARSGTKERGVKVGVNKLLESLGERRVKPGGA